MTSPLKIILVLFISAETIKEFDSHAMKDTEKAKESPPKEIVSEGQCYSKLHMH